MFILRASVSRIFVHMIKILRGATIRINSAGYMVDDLGVVVKALIMINRGYFRVDGLAGSVISNRSVCISSSSQGLGGHNGTICSRI